MPVYPGTPAVRIKAIHTLGRDGFREKQLILTTHTGTHVDAPGHILEDGVGLDQMPLTRFYGTAVCLDVRAFAGHEIPATFLAQRQKQWQNVEFLLLYSAFDRFWGDAAYFKDYPVLSLDALHLLLENKRLKGLGFDTISPDVLNSTDFPIHHALLQAGLLIIENLRNLKSVADRYFRLSLFPLPVQQADGMPVRAVAFVE